MKKIAIGVGSFIVGVVMTAGVTMAATTTVKAIQGTDKVQYNGQTVSNRTDLKSGSTTYLSLSSIESVLKKAGLGYKWSGSTLNVTSSSSVQSTGAIKTSSLPYTFKASDGMQITVNNIDATSSSTVFDVTFSNNGPTEDGDVYFNMFSSSLSDGGATVKLEQDSDADLESPYNPTYNDLHPGQTVQDTLTYDPLKAGATQFTWYFQDFSGNTHQLTFSLS
ncbi:hypothetical protein [Alicyclobacillus fastidiosus]|nr:hypothetical protein [Alicyclobacillus fastidiosus]GMA64714.1 hypothetical protein GCM10025859_51540 [Alicyclobacillus fastidiosus]